jgi:hypothetical protein
MSQQSILSPNPSAWKGEGRLVALRAEFAWEAA